ncbi:MAG: hypothetical protein ABJN69_01775 [Hellea sp.]
MMKDKLDKITVNFEREDSDGVQSKVWVMGKVLNFRNGKARRMIAPDIRYVIEWYMKGNAGDTLSISRTAGGETKKIVDGSTIPSGNSSWQDYTVDEV